MLLRLHRTLATKPLKFLERLKMLRISFFFFFYIGTHVISVFIAYVNKAVRNSAGTPGCFNASKERKRLTELGKTR